MACTFDYDYGLYEWILGLSTGTEEKVERPKSGFDSTSSPLPVGKVLGVQVMEDYKRQSESQSTNYWRVNRK